MRRFPRIALLALAACTVPCWGQVSRPALENPPMNENEHARTIEAAAREAAADFMKSGQTVALSIGVIQEGKEYTYNFGTTERGKNHPPTARTPYFIGSITKTFTGALLARAVTEKKVLLDDDVRRYLDGDYPNLEYEGHPIRLWQLINHTSGLPRDFPESVNALRGEPGHENAEKAAQEAALLERYMKEDFLRDLRGVTLTRVPGQKFSYSNVAAQLLGLVLERVYGKSYEALLHEKVTGPLKMPDTKATLTAVESARLPRAYGAGKPFLPAVPTRFPAAGSLTSTTADLLKYAVWQLAEKDEAVRMCHQPAGDTVWSADGSFTVGLNWQMLKHPSGRNIFQDGYLPGFHAICVLYPEQRLGIVILTSEEARPTPSNLSPLVNRIAQAFAPRVGATP